MKSRILILSLLFGVFAVACQVKQTAKPSDPMSAKAINSHIAIFEIPALDINRAIDFYQSILSTKIEKMEFGDIQMGLFPIEDQMVFGTLIKGEGYLPSTNGVTIYLNAGNDLQLVLDKVESKGGKIIIPKTLHADESGYFAIFHDSEGNKMGLHSPN